jgi:glycosyltransferase involved in cell wall biosynthesis
MIKISNIILGHKQPIDVLKGSIESSLNQEYDKFETIFVNNSGDTSYPELKTLYPELKIIDTCDLPRGEARNKGVECSDGDIIVFLDADTIICDKDAFSKINKYSQEFTHGYGANRFWTNSPETFKADSSKFLGAIRKGDKSWLLSNERSTLPKNFDEVSGYHDLKEFTFPANFGFFTRKLFELVGGFSLKFKEYGGEDDYLGFLCFKENPDGFKLLNDISVLHISHPTKNKMDKSWSPGYANYDLVQNLILSENYSAFNINVLFGVKESEGEKALEGKQ